MKVKKKQAEEKIFKFQPFSERIANIDVDVFHRVQHRFEDYSCDENTHFYQCVQKWNALNLSESYESFCKELPSVETLPQLLVEKDNVVSILLKYIKKQDCLCLQPLLEAVVALARDLHGEFYEYYPKFLALLIELIEVKDTEQLDWTFTCLAYLFKFLWRCLVKDVDMVFNRLLPLLSDTKPYYVNNFAAESFAFVARKVKDKRRFLLLIMKLLESNENGISGCGRLLFEVLHGVCGQFHSSAEDILTVYLHSLNDKDFPHEILCKVLSHMINTMMTKIKPKYIEIFWKCTFVAVQNFSSFGQSENCWKPLEYLLELLYQVTCYRDGSYIHDPMVLMQCLVSLFSIQTIPESVLFITSNIMAGILMSPHISLPQEHASSVVITVMRSSCVKVLRNFVEKLFDYSGFESLILPRFLEHSFRHSFTNPTKSDGQVCVTELLHLLTNLVLHKAPLCNSGTDLPGWKPFTLDFSRFVKDSSESKFTSIFLGLLNISDVSSLMEYCETSLCALICIPHIKPLEFNSVKQSFRHFLENIQHYLQIAAENNFLSSSDGKHVSAENVPNKNETKVLLFLYSVAIESLIHSCNSKQFNEEFDFDTAVTTLLSFACNSDFVCSLRALDLCLTASDKTKLNSNLFKTLYGNIKKNLSSPYSKVRSLTLHILSLFEHQNVESSPPLTDWSLFSAALSTELIPFNIHDYREKLNKLQSLKYDSCFHVLVKNDYVTTAPLYYLFGVLFVNFQLFWNPVINLIASYAHGLQTSDFWTVFKERLESSVRCVNTDTSTFETHDGSIDQSEGNNILTYLQMKLDSFDDKPDYANYRILLWKSMTEFPDICEAKNRDIVSFFLSYINDEYLNSNSEFANSLNIKQNDNNHQITCIEDSSQGPELEATNELLKSVSLPTRFNSKSSSKMLLAHMTIFSKIKSPKSMYREQELIKLYYDFLLHKNPAVQSMALSCILTYKQKGILPYEEHLRGLIDDKKFKSELTVFRVDKETNVVQEEHRKEVMPVVMRILHSKMFAKTGLRTGGKGGGRLRRSLVLRFIAGCHEEEMKTFVEMTFKVYSKYIQNDPSVMVENILHSINLEEVIPPKRLQSSLNLLMVIIEQFGGLMGSQLLQYVIHILLCIGSIISGILMKRDYVHPGFLPALRNLKTNSLECVSRCFENFEEYQWDYREIDAVFEVFVWPWLEKLPLEGIHSPTPLLKLFTVWSNHPRYFVLFTKHKAGDTNMTPLPFIIKLLCGSKTQQSVTSAIMEILEHLLTLQDIDNEEENDKSPAIVVKSLLPVKQNIVKDNKTFKDLNFGSCLLVPHIHTILNYLHKKLASAKKGLGQQDLVVLSRVTELAQESETSDILIQVLLPVLMKKSGAGEEVITGMISSLGNLIVNIDHPEKYIRSITPLFSGISFPGPRKLLCNVLMLVANSCNSDQKQDILVAAHLITELNAWNTRWVEQPDFDRRLDAFKKIYKMIEENQISLELGSIIVHNCFYFLKNETDMSLRDSAGFCLVKLCPAICIKYKDSAQDREFLINQTIFHLVCSGIKDKNEAVQYQSISLLGVLARECGHLHPVLHDLSLLANKSDPEVDFFENIQHLQAHRKTRALLRFCNIARGLIKPPNPRTLTQFILPLATAFLCNEKYAGKNSVVDAAIEVLGVTCCLLPWHQYQIILTFYLNKLRHSVEYQKQLVRIIVAILDAFHYDISRAQFCVDSFDKVVETADNNSAVKLNASEDGKLAKTITENENQDTAESGSQSGVIEHDNLNDILNGTVEDDEIVNDDIDVTEKDPILAISRQTILARSAANRLISTIRTVLLPQLHRSIIRRTKSDTLHKVNKKLAGPDQDEEDILRVPIALAIVKLLQRLPKVVLDHNLPGIFMKLCNFLKSRLESVRRVTRETLQKIIVSLGPEYLPTLLREMLTLLTKGYQVHVLVYTVHSVLVALKGHYKAGDMDKCLQSVLEACKMDLFGIVSEEKEVTQITGKLKEARTTKSYDTFNILAQHITDKCFTDLLLPLKEVLAKNFSHKVIFKVSNCFRHVVLGLIENKFVSVDSLLIFSYGTSSESIPELITHEKKKELTPAEQEKLSRQKPDSFIIPSAPRNRHGTLNFTAKTSTRTNAHILVEFGLQLFYTLLKKEKLSSEDCRPLIDPMVPILCNCFSAHHTKLTILSVNCMTWLLKMDLPSVRSNITLITSSLLHILHKYAVTNLGKGENFNLVLVTFKAVTVLVRNVKYHTISADQLKVLLLYAEQDIHDYSRQATAFSLLKAILSRKLVAPEMEDVMKKVATLSITSEHNHVRVQARQVFHQFLMDYPLGKKIEHHLAFYISQLDFDLQFGRISALEMIHSIIESFPLSVLNQHCGLLFITLGARLINDDVPECKKMVAQCIKLMLSRLEKNAQNKLFDIVLLWLNDKKIEHRQLAAQLCGIFVQLEKCDFDVRFPTLLPLLLEQFRGNNITDDGEYGKYVRITPVTDTSEIEERAVDHLLFIVLQTYIKICQHCPSFLKHPDWIEYVQNLLDIAQYYLSQAHEWVRLAASQLLGYIFASLDPHEVALATTMSNKNNTCNNLVRHTGVCLKSLCLDLCAILQPGEILPELVDQVVKNLVFIGRIVKDIPNNSSVKKTLSTTVDEDDNDEDGEEKIKINLIWLVRRMRKIINIEIVKAPKSTALRVAVFKWIGAMAVNLDPTQLTSCVHLLLAPLVREMNTEEIEFADLRKLSKEVSNIIKKKTGMEKYTQLVSRIQLQSAARKAERKKHRLQEAVTDQEKAAKRKIRKQLRKKDEKRKRLDVLKGKKPGKRKIKRKLEISEDCM